MSFLLNVFGKFFHEKALSLRCFLIFSFLCVSMSIAALKSVGILNSSIFFNSDENGYCARRGIVAIAEFFKIGPSGSKALESLIRRGILIKIPHERVFLKPYISLNRPEEIKNKNFDEVWNSLSPHSMRPISLSFFKLLFIDHNIRDPIWRDRLWNYGCRDPRLAHYIIGAFDYFLYASFPKMGAGRKYSLCLRLYIGLFAAATLFFFYLLVKKSISRLAALCVLVLCLLNPTFEAAQVCISYEIIMNLFMAVSLLFLLSVERSFASGKNALLGIVGFSVFFGLAMSCKITAVTLFPLIFVVFLMRGKTLPVKVMFLYLSLIVLISFSIFYFTNPLLITDFKYGMKMLFTDRIDEHPIVYKTLMTNIKLLKLLVTYPFIFLGRLPSECAGFSGRSNIACDFNVTEKIGLGIGYVLFLCGLTNAILNRRYLPVMFFLSNLLFFYILFSVVGTTPLFLMHLLPLALSILWVTGHCFICFPANHSGIAKIQAK